MKDMMLEAIISDINEQAELIINQINEEIRIMHDDEMISYKEGLSKEQEAYLEKELNELKVLAVTKSSSNKLKTKHDLLKLRKKLVDSLFDEVKEKLLSFVKSEDYKSYLTKYLKEVNENGGYYVVSSNDLALFKTLVDDQEIRVEHLEIGGFKYVSEKEHIILDYTIDTKFKEQREWFNNHSGFVI